MSDNTPEPVIITPEQYDAYKAVLGEHLDRSRDLEAAQVAFQESATLLQAERIKLKRQYGFNAETDVIDNERMIRFGARDARELRQERRQLRGGHD